MDKHYQQMPEPVRVPRIKLCDTEPDLDPSKVSPLQCLEKRCETNSDWFRFALHTARVFISCNRTNQARELIDLAEKRLLKLKLKLKQRPLYFRNWIQAYTRVREEAGLGCLPSQGPGKEQLNWYLTAPVDDDLSLLKLDQMHGARWYITLKCDSPPSSLRQLASAVVEWRAPQEMDFIFLGSKIVLGSDTQGDQAIGLAFVEFNTLKYNCRLDLVEYMVKSIELFGFKFSRRGIVRVR